MRAMPFAGHLGIEVLSAEPVEVRLRLRWSPEVTTTDTVMHGGALMSLADT